MMSDLPPRLGRQGINANWDLSDDEAIDQYIAARVAELAEREAVRWRLRLVVVETVVIAALFLAAGIAAGVNTQMVVRSAALVAFGCFATGVVVIAFSAGAVRILSLIRKWRAR